MSNYNSDGVFVHTGLLRDHVSKLQKQRRIAEELYANVLAMRNCSDPETFYQYQPLLRDIEQLIDYFIIMARTLSNVEDYANLLSLKLKGLIEDDTARTHSIVSKTILL